MRTSPSIVPHGADQDTYLVLDDFARRGRAWCETDEEHTDRKTLVRDVMSSQYGHPVQIVVFNTAEGWSRDVTDEIAEELRDRCAKKGEVPLSLRELLYR